MQPISQQTKQTAQTMYEYGHTYKEIAEKAGVSVNTLRSWIRREHWKRNKGATTTTNATTTAKNAATNAHKRKHGATTNKLHKNAATDERWKEFSELYLRTLNATQSYMTVYKVKYNTAMVNGSRLLSNAKVQEYLQQLKAEHQSQLFIDTQDLLQEEAKIAKADLSNVLNVVKVEQERIDPEGNTVQDIDGNPIIDRYNELYMKESDEVDWSIISEVHRGKDGLVVKLHDKQKAIETLLKQLPNPKNELELEKLKLQNKRLELINNSLDTDNDTQMSAIDSLMNALEGADDELAAKEDTTTK